MSQNHCAECGTELPVGILGKRCPQCLLHLGLRAGGEGKDTVAAASAGPVRYFGDYELLEEIARGGMGIVYRARQVSLNRIVAVKMILFGELAGRGVVERFRREAEAAARLQHPNIVAVHEVGEHEGQNYFSMDYVAGPNLAGLIGHTPLPTQRAARYVQRIAEAIAYAHGQGVLHRDLKPSNVLIDPMDEPRLTDFGLAKRFGAPDARHSAPDEAGTPNELTLSGQVMGTPNYLAPEQASGQRAAVGPASDVYGLGAILYFLLSARPPVMGESLETTLDQVLHQEPVSPRLLNGSVPRDLETICLKCLEKEPSRRYGTAQALVEELVRFQRGEPILARPIGLSGKVWRWCKRKPVVASLTAGLALAFVLGFTGILWQWQVAESERQLQRRYAYASAMKAAQVALQQNNRGLAMTLLRRYHPKPGEEDLRGIEWRYLWQESRSDALQSFNHAEPWIHDVALSSNGQYLATSVMEKIRIWDTVSGKVLKQFPRGGTLPFKKSLGFSADSNWLAIRGPKGIEIRETTGWSVVKELGPLSDFSPLVMSADGRKVVACNLDGLQVWDWASGNCRVLTNSFAWCNNLAVSQDGSRVAFSSAIPLYDVWGSNVVWDLERGASDTIASHQDTTSLAISPDGDWLASGHYSGKVCCYRLSTRELIGPFSAHRGMVYGLAFSPNGTLLASGGNDQLLHLWRTGTTNQLRTLRGHESEVYCLAFSSDGQTLISGGKDGTARLWSVEPDTVRACAFELPTNTVPVGPIPDGSALLTVDAAGKETRLWRLPRGELMRAQSWEEAERRGCASLRFFPKSQLAIGITTNGTAHLWDLATGIHQKAVPLGGGGFDPQHLSSDQRWLLGTMHGEEAVFVLGDLQKGTRIGNFAFGWRFCHAAAFSPDNRSLAFSTFDRGEAIKVWDLAAHRLKQNLARLSAIDPFGVMAMAYSPDGQLLACGGYAGEIQIWLAKTGKPIEPRLKGHIVAVGCLAFSADGKTLVSSGGDQSIRLWNVPTRQETLLFPEALMTTGEDRLIMGIHDAGQAELTPGDRWMLWRQPGGRVRVAELPSREEIDAGAKGLSQEPAVIPCPD